MPKRFPYFEVLLVILILAAHLYVVFAPANSVMSWYTTDDAFYYFKTAQNIAEGNGVTFDQIGTTNGFHPLWMLVCIPVFALAKTDLILPLRIIVFVLALLNAGSGVLLYRTLRKVISAPASALAALFWTMYPGLHAVTTQLGMESGINAFFILLLLNLTIQYEIERAIHGDDLPRLLMLGVVAIFTVFSRLDNIFLVGVLGIWLAFRSRRVRYFILADGLFILTGVIGSYLYRLGWGVKYYQYLPSALWMIGLAVALKPLAFFLFGLYRAPRTYSFAQLCLRIFAAASLSSVIITGALLAFHALGLFVGLPRSALLVDWIVTLALMGGLRLAVFFADRNPADLNVHSHWRDDLKRLVRNGLAFYGPVVVAMLIYMAWNLSYAGTPTPVSGQIKRWWGTLPNTVYGHPADNLENFFGLTIETDTSPWGFVTSNMQVVADRLTGRDPEVDEIDNQDVTRNLTIGLAVLSAALLFIDRRKSAQWMWQLGLLAFFTACMIHVGSYKAIGYVESIRWYWVSELILTVIMGALVVEGIYNLIRRIPGGTWVNWGITAVLGVMLVSANWNMLKSMAPWVVWDENKEAYLGGAQALEAITQPGDLIGSTGGGTIAYFIKDRTVVNLDGLINSYEYFQHLQAGNARDYLDRIGLDYVYGNEYMLSEADPYWAVLKNRLDKIGMVAGSTLFHYKIQPDQ